MPASNPRNITLGRWQTKGPVSTNRPFKSFPEGTYAWGVSEVFCT